MAAVQLGTLSDTILKRSVDPKIEYALWRALAQFDGARQVTLGKQRDGRELAPRYLLLRDGVDGPGTDGRGAVNLGDGQDGQFLHDEPPKRNE
jgi:hypothetical protein